MDYTYIPRGAPTLFTSIAPTGDFPYIPPRYDWCVTYTVASSFYRKGVPPTFPASVVFDILVSTWVRNFLRLRPSHLVHQVHRDLHFAPAFVFGRQFVEAAVVELPLPVIRAIVPAVGHIVIVSIGRTKRTALGPRYALRPTEPAGIGRFLHGPPRQRAHRFETTATLRLISFKPGRSVLAAAVAGAATEADVGAPLVSLVLNAELAVGLGRFVAKVVVVTVEESCGVEEGTFGGKRARERYT